MDYMSVPAIGLAILLHMVIGALWYSPRVFGNAFIKLAHPQLKPGEMKADPKAMQAAMLGSAMAMPVFCFLLSVVRPETRFEGSLWGAMVALLLDGGLNISHNLFEKRPFALTVIHTGYHAISLWVVGLVLVSVCGVSK